MSTLGLLSLVGRLGGGLVGLASRLVLTLPDLEDGKVTPAEAEAIARQVSAEAGDVLHIELNGIDVVGPAAQADLAAGLARILVRAISASRS